MAKNATTTQEELKELKARQAQLTKRHHMECNHASGLIPLSEYNGLIRNRQDYSETTVIHPECGAIFESAIYTPREVDAAFFTIESMCHQIKTMTGDNMDEQRRNELIDCMASLESLQSSLAPYYNSMTKALGNKTKKGGRQDRQVGGIGINASMFH